MRTKNAIRNAFFSIALEIVILVFGLFMPRLIILTYGSAVNGLTSTINNILSILTLLQAGAAGASIYEMYRPVAEEDYETISRILQSSRRYFSKLGVLFLVLVAAVAPIVAISKAEPGLSSPEIAFSVLILGINVAYTFFVFPRYDILFCSFQKRYYFSIASIIEKTCYYGLLFLVLSLRLHFIWMYLAVFAGSTIKALCLWFIYRRQFASRMVAVSKKSDYPIPNRKYLLVIQVSLQILTSAPVVLVGMLYNLSLASVFSVYALIQTAVRSFVSTLELSTSAIFGNLVASESEEKTKSVSNLIFFVFSVSGAWLCSCTAYLFMPFINIYTSDITDISYHYPLLAVLVVAYGATFCLYKPAMQLTSSYGLYRQLYKPMCVFSIIGLLLSAGLGLFSMPLVLTGVVFFNIAAAVCHLAVAKRHIRWFTFQKLPQRIAILLLFPIVGYLLYLSGFCVIRTWSEWFFAGCITAAVSGVVLLFYCLMFERKEFKSVLGYARALLKRKKPSEDE